MVIAGIIGFLKMIPDLLIQGGKKLFGAPVKFLQSAIESLAKLPGLLFGAVKSLLP